MTITSDHPFFSEEAFNDMVALEYQLEAFGWVKCPEWFPAGIQGYEWRYPGNVSAYMLPKPKLRHVLRYKYVPNWWHRYKAKKFINKTIKFKNNS